MIKIYNKEQKNEWNRRVKSYDNWDVYYTYEYVHALMLHGDGEPMLICYEDQDVSMCYAVMKSDIAKCLQFQGVLAEGELFDWETPYGYGGPLTDTEIPVSSQQKFKQELMEYCRDENIVAQFVRFNPLSNNAAVLPGVIERKYLRDTVYMDTTSAEIIWNNLDSKNRNMVRKAVKQKF